MRLRNFIFLAPLFWGLAGCSKAPQNREAIEKAVVEYLKGRPGLDMNSMDLQVTGLNFRENEADATVVIQAKGSKDPAGSMTMRYVLEQKNGTWAVKGRAGGNEHGAGAAPPSGQIPAQGTLPPGHPPMPPGDGKSAPGSEGKK